ncbi:hypothetical protein C9I57_12580 [Trinickia symbiotica]|uniref:Uncharacterized protein n=1 Tax=Trinickia symbiotica TaxID=863227 RepID=A0A2T3XVY6_9BURK|nr:hypothetical protein C9I57_12580 [Trinickia symbiotica]
MSDISVASRTARPSIHMGALGIASLAFLAGLIYLDSTVSGRQAALWIVGGLLGVSLYHASFGFTSAWRRFISDRRGAGLRAQMAMLALGVVLFFPALSSGTLFGHPVAGHVLPAGTSVIVGSFLFGLGMQLGGGCASGTLFAIGGGNTRMIVTLFFFVVGSLIGTQHFAWWAALPAPKPFSFITTFGVGPAIAINLALFGAVAWLTVFAEKRRHGTLQSGNTAGSDNGPAWLVGPWPMWVGAIALAVLNFATLALAGRPWGITSAFALWGAKGAAALGVDVANWSYWQHQAKALAAPLSFDVTTIMDIAIMIGALAASALAGRFQPGWRVPPRSLAAAVIGGLLLGYGARLSFGCNIGAYFSGIVSGSLHGWLWAICAFVGSVVGTRLRPVFGLANEKTVRQTAC